MITYKDIREKYDLSQNKLSQLLGVSQASIALSEGKDTALTTRQFVALVPVIQAVKRHDCQKRRLAWLQKQINDI